MMASTVVPSPSDRGPRARLQIDAGHDAVHLVEKPLTLGRLARPLIRALLKCLLFHKGASSFPSVAYPVAHRELRINQTFPSYKHACMGRVFMAGCV